jgi:hypothetical protein
VIASGDPISIAALSGEEGGDDEVDVYVVRARVRTELTDVSLL